MQTLCLPCLPLLLPRLKVLKVLSRKEANRKRFGDAGVRVVLLSLAPPLTMQIAAEGANVLLNIRYAAGPHGVLLPRCTVATIIIIIIMPQ